MNLRELDILVAEKVFRYKVEKGELVRYGEGGEGDYYYEDLIQKCDIHSDTLELMPWSGTEEEGGFWTEELPRYSEYIEDAYKVLEYVLTDGWKVEITGSEYLGHMIGGFEVKFSCKSSVRGRLYGDGKTLQEAICVAAVKLSSKFEIKWESKMRSEK